MMLRSAGRDMEVALNTIMAAFLEPAGGGLTGGVTVT